MSSKPWISIAVGAAMLLPTTADARDFNEFILQAIEELKADYSGGGYDLSSAFTHNIAYGDGVIPSTSGRTPPAPSMCVAGVTEVILTAINLYVKKTHDRTPYTTAPLSLWTRGNPLSLRANLFMFGGAGSRGTGHTLKRFGMGQELGFESLKPGDFINLNRTTKSGHAVVFIGYLDKDGNSASDPSQASGFKYFSLQGKGKPDAGFGYRYAFFEGTCPTLGNGRVRDCHVLRSRNPVLLNAGRMNMPAEWKIAKAMADLRAQGLRDIMGADAGATRAMAESELERDLPERIDPALDGVTEE